MTYNAGLNLRQYGPLLRPIFAISRLLLCSPPERYMRFDTFWIELPSVDHILFPLSNSIL